jgi:predicted transcriptional regulator
LQKNGNNNIKVRINKIIELTNSRVVAGDPALVSIIKKAFSSDLMSDVLTLDEENVLLITGLANVQLLRTAEMAEINTVLLARNKKASPEMIQLAEENGVVLLETPFSIFKTSGILFSNGLKPVY